MAKQDELATLNKRVSDLRHRLANLESDSEAKRQQLGDALLEGGDTARLQKALTDQTVQAEGLRAAIQQGVARIRAIEDEQRAAAAAAARAVAEALLKEAEEAMVQALQEIAALAATTPGQLEKLTMAEDIARRNGFEDLLSRAGAFRNHNPYAFLNALAEEGRRSVGCPVYVRAGVVGEDWQRYHASLTGQK
jgi:hypothetical protein